MELNGDVMKAKKLSAKDRREFAQVVETQRRVSQGVGKTVGAAPDDEGLYDQLLASTDRFREETDRAIKIVEQILKRNR